MALRGKKPDPLKKRLKFMLQGVAGVGKTTAALQMPKPYVIYTETGIEHDQYMKLMDESGAVVFQTQSMTETAAEIRALTTEKHDFKTLVIDSFTPLYENELEEWERKFKHTKSANRFASEYQEANKASRRLFRHIVNLDMNVCMTFHEKDVFDSPGQVTHDGYKKWPYLFDLQLRLTKEGSARFASVLKTRLPEFVDAERFAWSFDELASRYGLDDLTRQAEPVEMANPEQVERIGQLIGLLKLSTDVTDKWLSKADAETFAELTGKQIKKAIAFCEGKIKEATEEQEEVD